MRRNGPAWGNRDISCIRGGRPLSLPRVRAGLPWIAGLIAGALILLVLRIQGTGAPSKAEEAAADPAASDLVTYTSADTVHRGDTLAGLLLRNRMGLTEIERILREIRTRDYFSPRSLMPGQVLEFTRDESGRLCSMRIRCSPEEVFVFEMNSDTLRSFAQAVDCEVRVRKLSGTIQSTLEEAVISAGGDPRVAVKLADVMSYDIDFFTELRKGDEFSVLIEERYVEGAFVSYGEILYGWYNGSEARAGCSFYRGLGGRGGYYDLDGRSLKRAFLKSPLNYRRISSQFTNRRFHPILKTYRPHHGVDYAAAAGTPIVALGDGTVEYAGWKGGYGKYIKIRHDRSHSTCYGHLSGFASGVRSGAKVQQGQKIGYVGRTGLATGPHLHFEMIENGKSINPLAMRTTPAEPIPSNMLDDYRKHVADLSRAETMMAAGAVLDPPSWTLLVAQNEPPIPESIPSN